MPFFKALIAKYRPALKELLTADQYIRLRQIAWQHMGTGAFSDDELIEALKISKEQDAKIAEINNEYYIKRRELNQQMSPQMGRGPLGTTDARESIRLRRDEDARISESLSKELQDRLEVLKGPSFELRQLRSPGSQPLNADGGGRKSRLLDIVGYQAVQTDLRLSEEVAEKIRNLSEKYRASIKRWPGRTTRPTEDDIKADQEAQKKIQEANRATTEEAFTKLKETLSADQLTRLRQIYWQDIGMDVLNDSEMVAALPVSDELKEKIKAIRKETEDQNRERSRSTTELRKKLVEFDQEHDAKIDEVLTKAQQDQYTTLLGQEFDLIRARSGFYQSEEGRKFLQEDRLRSRTEQDRLTRNGKYQGVSTEPRRRLLSLLENHAVQNELELTADVIEKIKNLSSEVHAAVTANQSELPNFEKLSPEESRKVKLAIETTDQAVTTKFLPVVKQILTADQFLRLKQIDWQTSSAIEDPEVIETLALTNEQQQQLREIKSEREAQRDEFVQSAGLNAITVRFVVQGRGADANRRMSEQYQQKVNDVLTKDQQEKLAAIKGKPFDNRLLRQ